MSDPYIQLLSNQAQVMDFFLGFFVVLMAADRINLRGGFLPRHDEDLREPLVRRQGSQVSMRVARVDVFLELSCFLYDPADVGNLISGSSAFSKTSLHHAK